REPFEWPSFALPVRIELDDVQLQDLYVQRGTQQLVYLRSVSGSVSLGTFNFRLSEYAVETPYYGAEVTGRIGLRYPYAANLSGSWAYVRRAGAGEAAVEQVPSDFSGALSRRGDIQERELEHQLAPRFVITSEGPFLPNAGTEDDQPRLSPNLE